MPDPLFKVKKAFFDSEKVKKALDTKTRKVLSGFGARVRRTAQFSMKSRKGRKGSPPGKPPFAHGQKLLRKLLFFAYDANKKSVVIGPVLIESTKKLGVPRLHEEGGVVSVNTKKGRVVRKYPPRPYMKPAFDEHRGNVTKSFKGNLK